MAEVNYKKELKQLYRLPARTPVLLKLARKSGRPRCSKLLKRALAEVINAAHVRTRETYGPERLQKERATDGFHADVGRIKRLRNKQLGNSL